MGLTSFVLFLERFGGESFIFLSCHLSEHLRIQELLFAIAMSGGSSFCFSSDPQATSLTLSEPW